MTQNHRRAWIDRVLVALSFICVFWAGAAFALASSFPLISLLIAAVIAWIAADD